MRRFSVRLKSVALLSLSRVTSHLVDEVFIGKFCSIAGGQALTDRLASFAHWLNTVNYDAPGTSSDLNGNGIEAMAAAAAGLFGGDEKAPRQKTDQVRNQAGIVQEHSRCLLQLWFFNVVSSK